MAWDPFDTLRRALWIGGAQWAGKSTVADLLAHRHGITAYHYDYHDARGHWDRRAAAAARRGAPYVEPDLERMWIDTTPERMVADAQEIFRTRFEYTLDDLRALVSPRPILVEGFGLRPDLVAPLIDDPGRMVVLVPGPDLLAHQLEHLPRAAALGARLSDPALGQRHRLTRDELLADDAVQRADACGMRTFVVGLGTDAETMCDLLTEHFAGYLP